MQRQRLPYIALSLALTLGCGGSEGGDDGADVFDASGADSVSPDTVGQDTAPEDVTGDVGLDLTPTDTTPEDVGPTDTSPEDVTPEDTMPEDTMPEDTAPEDTAPEEVTPEDTMPEDTALEDTTPDADAEDTTLDVVAPDADIEEYVPRASAGCGSPNVLPTDQTTVATLTHDGQLRTWRIYLPDAYDGFEPLPVVIGLHGGLGSGAQFENDQATLNAVAQREGFAVVYPDGTSGALGARTWNAGDCCGASAADNVDDVGYVGALLDSLSDSFCLDERRVYATGISNGGMLSIRLACELSERIAAVAPVAAPLTYNACAPSRAVPIMHIHGDADAHVPIEGGFGCGLADIEFKSLDQSMGLWADENTCTGDPTELLREGNGVCTTEGECAAETVRCVIEGGGHDWHGGVPREGSLAGCEADGLQSQTFNTSEQIWTFFSRQHLPE